MPKFAPLIALLAWLLPAPLSAAGDANDARFLEGYLTAILEREFPALRAHVTVGPERVEIIAFNLSNRARAELDAVVERYGGGRALVLTENAEEEPPAAPIIAQREERATAAPDTSDQMKILPSGDLFEPLIADPRWHHLYAGYRNYGGNAQLENVGVVGFGERFSAIRYSTADAAVELALEGGVHAIFDLDAQSSDLINADYWGGIVANFRRKNFSLSTRIYHMSSHLGDEFLLRGRADRRVNVSFEAINVLASHELTKSLRVYGGGEYIIAPAPAELERWGFQAGAEWRGARPFVFGRVRPLVAADFKAQERADYDLATSLRGGISIAEPGFGSSEVQLLLEYFSGPSPDGQFFDLDIETFGFGAHIHF